MTLCGRHLLYEYDRKDLDHALGDIDAALALKPDDYAYLDARASLYTEKGELERAIADYDASIRLNPSHATYVSRGDVWREIGNYQRALVDYEAAYRDDPTYANAIAGRNVAHAALALGPALDASSATGAAPTEAEEWRVSSEKVGVITVEDWHRGRTFDHCAVLQRDEKLAVGLGRGSHGYALTLSSSGWSMPPGQSYAVRLALPNAPEKAAQARTADAITIAIQLGADETFVNAMQHTSSLEIRTARGVIHVPLFAIDTALGAIDRCWDKEIGAPKATASGRPGQNPFATEEQGAGKPRVPPMLDLLAPAVPR